MPEKMANLIWSPRAFADLEKICQYICTMGQGCYRNFEVDDFVRELFGIESKV